MGHPTPPANLDPRKSRWWVWPTIVGTLLAVHTAGMLFAVSIANRDRSFKVDPDYYRKGLTLDARKAQLAASDKLGWTVSVSADLDSSKSARTVAVKLLDRQGQPLTGATIALSFYHHARGSDVRTLTLTDAVTPGVYTASTNLTTVGFWQVDFVVTRGSDTFVKTIDAQYVR
jgi:nitrogen fixation protein FixH